jgi:hypothetical protein
VSLTYSRLDERSVKDLRMIVRRSMPSVASGLFMSKAAAYVQLVFAYLELRRKASRKRSSAPAKTRAICPSRSLVRRSRTNCVLPRL